ncbi:MAG TPA: aminopeptidase P family protein [Candidatus Acidoferrales bacterium]
MKLRTLAVRGAALVVAVSFLSFFASARFPQPPAEYQARRAKLRTQFDGPVVIFGYTSHEDSSEFAVFFQEPSFYYLTGDPEPDAALVLLPDAPAQDATAAKRPRETLYLAPRDLRLEKWDGPKMGPDDPGIAQKTGFEAVAPYAQLKTDLAALAKTYKAVYTILPPKIEDGYPHFTDAVAFVHAAVPDATVKDAAPAIYAMRQVKSAGEIALLQKAVDLSVDAHVAAMHDMRPGLWEYQIAAHMKEVHEMGGCEREAYAPIVGTGLNSTVLHYSALTDQIMDGDVVVIDVGGEYGGYAADITRTLPANGKFTARQREIYEIVLGAQNAAIAAVKPGAKLSGGKDSLMQISMDYINTHGKDQEGNALGKYYIHGVSHHLGLDVHDPGDRARPLEAGMIITVEPGIYIPEEKIGVRIEDDVLVTADGSKILSGKLPRTVDEVEATMAAGRSTPEKSNGGQ